MNRVADIKREVEKLPIQDLRMAFQLLMIQFDALENTDAGKAELYNSLKELYDELLTADDQVTNNRVWEPDIDTAKVHIVFGESTAGSLKLVIKQLGYADTNKVICIKERFAVGPLWRLHEEEGRSRREEWLRDHLNDGYSEIFSNDDEVEVDHRSLLKRLEQIPDHASIIIWSSKNAYEQVGLRYIIHLLRHRKNELFVFNAAEACEQRFNTPDRRIDYLYSGEITTEKLKAVFGEAEGSGPLTIHAREQLEQEWLGLAEQQEVLRIWDGERIVSVDEHYFDTYLLETVDKLHSYKGDREFIKAARIIGEAYGYCEQYIGDAYFEYRLRHLVYNGLLEIKGVPRSMRHYSVRLKAND